MTLSATDGVVPANQIVKRNFLFPKYRDVVCKASTLQLQTTPTAKLTFNMPSDGSKNTQVLTLPIVEDTVSKTKLNDSTGVTACGLRTYAIKNLADKDKVEINSATREIWLKSTMTKDQAGTLTVPISVTLAEFNQVTALTVELTIELVVVQVNTNSTKPVDTDKQPTPTNNTLPADFFENCTLTHLQALEPLKLSSTDEVPEQPQPIPSQIKLSEDYPVYYEYPVTLYGP